MFKKFLKSKTKKESEPAKKKSVKKPTEIKKNQENKSHKILTAEGWKRRRK